MMTTGEKKHSQSKSRTSLEQYLMMNETEKDIEIQNAISRLQKRIHEILYTLEAENKQNSGLEVMVRNKK